MLVLRCDTDHFRVFTGPTAGPVLSGFINANANWRWTWIVIVIWGFVELCALVLFVPETFLPVVLKHKAKRLRKAGRTDVKVSTFFATMVRTWKSSDD
jgi:MFS family permease